MARICVFCGAAPGRDPLFRAAARDLGALLAARGITLVYGGAGVGLMAEVAGAALDAGGRVVGVIPQVLVDRELAHARLSDLRVVASLPERKALMAALSHAFIALPGGFGTLDELSEMLTWNQLGLQAQPCGVLNVNGYYDHLLAFADRAVADGLLRPAHRRLLLAAETPETLLQRLAPP